MQYFVTGATGFIGKRLVKTLLARKGADGAFPDAPGQRGQGAGAARVLGRRRAARAVPVFGDLTAQEAGRRAPTTSRRSRARSTTSTTWPRCTTSAPTRKARSQVNIEGTRNTVEFAKAIDAGHFHHVSSIAAAGLYEGVFREDMFEEAENLDHPYFMTKHESEKIVRKECKVPWTVYRPALVVGDSQTGEMDKIDGPYYFFKLIQRMRQLLPPWMPAVGPRRRARQHRAGGLRRRRARPHLATRPTSTSKLLPPGRPGGLPRRRRARHLQPAAHAPKMNLFVNAALLGFIPKSVKKGLMALAPVRRIRNAVHEGPRPARGHARPSSTTRPASTAARPRPRSRAAASSART